MTGERRKLGYELSRNNSYLLRDATPHLQQQKFDPEREYFEFLIRGKIRSEDLRALLTLPYEVSLDGEDNITLSTGNKGGVANEEDIRRRRDNGKLYFHTHPYSEGKFQGSPSLFDALHSNRVKDNTTLSLAHSEGIIIYRRPFLDPATKGLANPSETVLNIIKNYAILNRIWLGTGEIPEEVKGLYDKRFIDLNKKEIFGFTRQFAEETGMIVDEAKWEDKDGLERVVAKAFKGIRQ